MDSQTEKISTEDHVLRTPIWVTVVRGFQAFIALIILALCARLMHDAYLEEEGFSLAMSLFTWLAVAYIVVSEKVTSLNHLYNVFAVLAVDGLMMILWLACFAATASRRAKYKYNVSVNNCYNNGKLVNSKQCTIAKRSNVVLFPSGLSMLSAVAGLGALVWLLFIASFVWTLLQFLKGRKEGRFALNTSAATPSNNYQMENKVAEAQPMNTPQPYQSQTQQPAAYQDGQVQQAQYGAPVNNNFPQQQQQPYVSQGYAPQDQQQQQQPQQQFQGQQPYGQFPPKQQQQQPIQPPQAAAQSQPYGGGSELSGHTLYSTPPPAAVSPPPHQYQTSPPPQPQQYQQYPQN